MRTALIFLFLITYSTMQALSVNYTITIKDPNSHYAQVTMEISGIRGKNIDVKMPVWTPGSYMVREFERNVQSVSAKSGDQSLKVMKTDKSTWNIANPKGLSSISVIYSIYCFEAGV